MDNSFILSEEDLQAGYAENEGFKAPDSGLYPSTITAAYEIPSNSSESVSLEIAYETDDGKTGTQSIWYIGKNGLTTRVNDKGQTVPTFGMVELQNVFAACGVAPGDVMASAGRATVKRYGKEEDVKIYEALTGKRVILGLRKKMEDGYPDPSIEKEFTEVELWANENGQSGEELNGKHNPKTIAVFEKIIAKKPVVDRRKYSLAADVAMPATEDTNAAAEAALGSWGS